MKLDLRLSVTLLLLVCSQTLNSQSNRHTDSSDIHSRFSGFQQALTNRDTLALGDFYTADAVSLLQNQPVRQGRDLIMRRWSRSLANPIDIRMTSVGVNVSASGQDGFQFGLFEIRSADSASTLLASGKIMLIWKKEPDAWRIALEMDNFNALQSPKPAGQVKQ